MSDRVRVGFIGTGLIGAPMVERLLERAVDVTVWNRSADKLAPLVAQGATAAPRAIDVPVHCALVCLCLTDTAAVEAVVFGDEGIAAALDARHLLIDLSSIDPDATRRMAARLERERGARWIDTPVSGGVVGARAGRLIVFAGGDAADVARAAPVFDALAQRVTHMGAHGAGQFTKSCNQQLVACNLMVIAEMMAFAERAGVDATQLPAALAGGWADSLPFQVFGPRMAADIDTPRIGAVGTFQKDIDQVVRLAAAVGASVPVTAFAAARYADAAAQANITREGDASRLIRLLRPDLSDASGVSGA